MNGTVTGDALEASAEHKTVGARGPRGKGPEKPRFFGSLKTELSGERVGVCPGR